MSSPWAYLLYRYGSEIRSPSSEQIQDAAVELFEEDLPNMTEGDYEEHGAASLRYGFDAGPVYVLEVTRSGKARWEEWKDQDFNSELAPPKEMVFITEEQVVELWNALSEGRIEAVRAAFAGCP